MHCLIVFFLLFIHRLHFLTFHFLSSSSLPELEQNILLLMVVIDHEMMNRRFSFPSWVQVCKIGLAE